MPIFNSLTLTAAVTAIALAVPGPGFAETNMLFILDGSNSMWGRVEGVAKIKTAQDVLADLMADLPKDTKVGLMVYGHRSKVSCDDIEILSPIGADGPAKLVEKIRSIQPTGKTPIANALFGSLIAFSKFEGQNNHVVLISDGIETCGGDVCMAASVIANANIKPRVHVVGFDVGAKERAQLECIPKMGNGKYFSAANAGELKKAVAQVKQVAQAAPQPPKPKKPKKPKKKGPKEVFRDDFNGDELADHWEVINPNPDAFIVEDGVLTVLTSGNTPLIGSDKLENVFRLTKSMPKGDWTATMRFKPEVATFRELYILALYKDKNTMLAATTGNAVVCCDNAIVASLTGQKVSKGKPTGFSASVLRSPGIGNFKAAIHNYTNWTTANEKAILMRIEKSGRNYVISAKIEGEITMKGGKKPQWVKIQKLTSLRPPGNSLVMALTQKPYTSGTYQVGGGEALVAIDWIKIEVPAKAE